jgi:hypothetical protein
MVLSNVSAHVARIVYPGHICEIFVELNYPKMRRITEQVYLVIRERVGDKGNLNL